MQRPGRRARLRSVSRLAVLTLAGGIAALGASVALAAPASASVPTCAGLGRFTGRQVWVNTAANHQLVNGINSLICSAADGATIDLKSWFLVDDDALVNSMVARLRLMQRYHHVHVNVLVGYSPRHTYALVKKAFPFAHFAACRYGCLDQHSDAISHSKWMTVSRLRTTGTTALLSTSTNWSHGQFTITQSGLLVVGDRSLYDAFVSRWSILSRCTSVRCSTPRTTTWLGSGVVRVMFFPTATGDPIADALAKAACARGGSLRVSSLFLTRPAVVAQLEQARQRGCTVRVLLGVVPAAAVNRALTPHVGRIHDKMLLISTPRLTEVISGSANFTGTGLRSNDEQLVEVATPGTVSAYRSFFDSVWTHTPPAPTARPQATSARPGSSRRPSPALQGVPAADL